MSFGALQGGAATYGAVDTELAKKEIVLNIIFVSQSTTKFHTFHAVLLGIIL